MQFIAEDLEDSTEKLSGKLTAEKARPDHAIDRYFYRSHLVYERELKHLIFRSWVYACHASELPEKNDFLLFDVGEESIILTRDGKGEIRALHNICRHRGARICEEKYGNKKTFVCPYHGWVYNTDGTLKAAREMHMRSDFDPHEHGLISIQTTVFMGLVFINCDPKAADFSKPLENLREPLGAYDLEKAKVAHKHTYRIATNWKLVLENYLECYHCATSHRAYAKGHTLKDIYEKVEPVVKKMLENTEEVTGIKGMGKEYERIYLNAEEFGACVYTSRYGLYDGYKTGSEDGEPVAPLMGNIKDYDGGTGDFQMGPLSFMLNYPDHCVLYRFIPRSLTSTDMELVWFVSEDACEGKDYDKEKLTWLWHHTSLEDEYIINRNSEGLNSRFFKPGPYHPEFEATLQKFVTWYLHTLESTLKL